MASEAPVPVALVAAVARNGVIGAGNALIWRLGSDLRRFKALTMSKPMIMGRKTFASIGKPLPGRQTIVVTRDPHFQVFGVSVAPDVASALALAQRLAQESGAEEIIVAGGGEIYRQTIDLADRIHLTEVDLAPDGDAHFPPIDPARWRETSREIGVPGERDEAGFAFVEYVGV